MQAQQSFIQFNSSEQKSQFEIISLKDLAEKQLKKDYKIQKPHRLEYYSIIAITTGFGFHNIDFKKYSFTNGTFFFLAKEQIQSFDFKPGNEGFVITFNEEFLNAYIKMPKPLSQTCLFNYHLKHPQIQVNALEREYFFDIVRKIYQEYQSKNGFAKNNIIQTLLNLLLLKSERIKRNKFFNIEQESYNDLFYKFKDLIETNYKQTRNAKYYAEVLGISYKHLNNICKNITRKTAKEFIDSFLVLEAKRCLISSNDTIKKISKNTGFEESTNFIKYFKKHTGFLPVKYRAKFK